MNDLVPILAGLTNSLRAVEVAEFRVQRERLEDAKRIAPGLAKSFSQILTRRPEPHSFPSVEEADTLQIAREPDERLRRVRDHLDQLERLRGRLFRRRELEVHVATFAGRVRR